MGVQELLIVFAILLLFFGAKKLPGLAGSLGTSIKEFRRAAESVGEDAEDDTKPSGAAPQGERHGSVARDQVAREQVARDPAEHDPVARDPAERDAVDRDVER